MGSEIGQEKPRPRKPRADQLRNRERLLDAAREVFGKEGGSLEAVAREAGVGIGTLYRHFPSREALFQAVYAREVETLERRAAEDELEDWMRGALQLMATKRGMIAALAPVFEPDSTFFGEQSERLRGAIAALHARALADGAWAEAARIRLARDAGRLDALVTATGARLVGGTTLFRLYRHPRAAGLLDHLARAAAAFGCVFHHGIQSPFE